MTVYPLPTSNFCQQIFLMYNAKIYRNIVFSMAVLFVKDLLINLTAEVLKYCIVHLFKDYFIKLSPYFIGMVWWLRNHFLNKKGTSKIVKMWLAIQNILFWGKIDLKKIKYVYKSEPSYNIILQFHRWRVLSGLQEKKCAIPFCVSEELIDNYCASAEAHIYLFPSKWCHGFSYSYAFICIKGICWLREAVLFIYKLKLLNNSRFSMVLPKMVDMERTYFSIFQLFSFF